MNPKLSVLGSGWRFLVPPFVHTKGGRKNNLFILKKNSVFEFFSFSFVSRGAPGSTYGGPGVTKIFFSQTMSGDKLLIRPYTPPPIIKQNNSVFSELFLCVGRGGFTPSLRYGA